MRDKDMEFINLNTYYGPTVYHSMVGLGLQIRMQPFLEYSLWEKEAFKVI